MFQVSSWQRCYYFTFYQDRMTKFLVLILVICILSPDLKLNVAAEHPALWSQATTFLHIQRNGIVVQGEPGKWLRKRFFNPFYSDNAEEVRTYIQYLYKQLHCNTLKYGLYVALLQYVCFAP